MTHTHDTIIIGAGPGGADLAAILATRGERVVLVERGHVGGTCLNRGCIPTKTLCHAAEIALAAAQGADYGLATATPAVDWTTLMQKKQQVVDTLRQSMESTLQNVETIHATASLLAGGKVDAGDGRILSAPRIVIATGSQPASLPIPGAEHAATSDGFLSATTMPRSAVIIGGGVIGLEFASVLNALGCEVAVVEYCKEILPNFDRDIAKRLRTLLAARGIRFILSAAAKEILPDGTVRYESKGREDTVGGDTVIMAVGRKPIFPEGLDTAGVVHTPRGITVDPADFSTTAPGIYAIGDVNGICQLAHAATAQARIVAGEKVCNRIIPAAVFTSPEAAMAGETEENLKLSATPFKSVKIPLRSNGKAVSMGQENGLFKLIADPGGNILGCHAVGPHAADMVQTVAVAMAGGITAQGLASTVFAHPTLSEIIPAAAGRLI